MIRHALVQFKPYKNAIDRSLEHLANILQQLASEKIDVLCLPETALTGYYLQGGVREQAMEAEALFRLLQTMLEQSHYQQPLDICLGFYESYQGNLYNSALYAEFNTENAGIKHIHRKMFLPTYGVFDEARYVAQGNELQSFQSRFGRAGILICEDAWHATTGAVLALKGAEIIYVPMASPARGFGNDNSTLPTNAERWSAIIQGIATEHSVFVLNSSLVGFEGGKGFVGYAQAFDAQGACIAQGKLFEESVVITDIYLETIPIARYESPLLADLRANLPELIRNLQEAL